MLNLILFGGGLFVTLVASGGLLFTIREFRRFDHDTAEELAYLEAEERTSMQRPHNVVGLRTGNEDKKYIGAGI